MSYFTWKESGLTSDCNSLESMAYRFHGHSMADPSNYRDNEEVEKHISRDPIDRFRTTCVEEGLLTDADVSRINEEIDTSIQDAVEFAEQSPAPDSEALFMNVYSEPDKNQ